MIQGMWKMFVGGDCSVWNTIDSGGEMHNALGFLSYCHRSQKDETLSISINHELDIMHGNV